MSPLSPQHKRGIPLAGSVVWGHAHTLHPMSLLAALVPQGRVLFFPNDGKKTNVDFAIA